MLIPFKFNPEVHEIREVPAAQYLREHLKNPDLFVYFHRRTRNWCVGEWEPRKKWQWLTDALIVGPTLEGLTKDRIDVLDFIMNGPPVPNPKDPRKMAAEKEQELRNQLLDDYEFERWYCRTYAPGVWKSHPSFRRDFAQTVG